MRCFFGCIRIYTIGLVLRRIRQRVDILIEQSDRRSCQESNNNVELMEIVSEFTRYSKNGVSMGQFGDLRFSYCVDFLTAVHDEDHLKVMARHLVELVDQTERGRNFDFCACPKLGNTLLVAEVAVLLEKPLLFVRNSMVFGSFLEGVYERSATALLLDDVASSGEQTYSSFMNLRKSGIQPTSVAVLLDRAEGSASTVLKREGLQMHSCLSLTDEEIGKISHGTGANTVSAR